MNCEVSTHTVIWMYDTSVTDGQLQTYHWQGQATCVTEAQELSLQECPSGDVTLIVAGKGYIDEFPPEQAMKNTHVTCCECKTKVSLATIDVDNIPYYIGGVKLDIPCSELTQQCVDNVKLTCQACHERLK